MSTKKSYPTATHEFELEVEVSPCHWHMFYVKADYTMYGEYHPAVMYLRNGDPGFPEEYPELEWNDIKLFLMSIDQDKMKPIDIDKSKFKDVINAALDKKLAREEDRICAGYDPYEDYDSNCGDVDDDGDGDVTDGRY